MNTLPRWPRSGSIAAESNSTPDDPIAAPIARRPIGIERGGSRRGFLARDPSGTKRTPEPGSVRK